MLLVTEPLVPVRVRLKVCGVGGGVGGFEELPHPPIKAIRHRAPIYSRTLPARFLRRNPKGAIPRAIAKINGIPRKRVAADWPGVTLTTRGTLVTVALRFTLAGFEVQVAPEGAPLQVNETVPANPLLFKNGLKVAVWPDFTVAVSPPVGTANAKAAGAPALTVIVSELDCEMGL